jgi:hypothetical protein
VVSEVESIETSLTICRYRRLIADLSRQMLVRVIRTLTIIAASTLLTSCAQGPAKPVSSNRPVIDGRSELLPVTELEAVLRVARHRLNTVLLWAPIYRVHVITAAKVDVFFRSPGELPRWLRLQSVNGQWRVTDELLRDPPIVVT